MAKSKSQEIATPTQQRFDHDGKMTNAKPLCNENVGHDRCCMKKLYEEVGDSDTMLFESHRTGRKK